MTDGAADTRLDVAEKAKLTARITSLSVSVALSLLVLKAVTWYFSASVSLLASAIDSGLDLVAAMGTFWAVRIAALPADAEHRYGHGKAEAFASLMQVGLVLVSGVLIAREALDHLMHPAPVGRQDAAILVMIASTVLTLLLVAAQAKVIASTRSVAIKGDQAHYIADAASNAGAIVGLALTHLTGSARWDALAGLFVAAWLVKGAVGVLLQASSELLDREADELDRERILKLALDDEAVLGIHQFRSRVSGPFLHVQMHMELEASQSLFAAHEIVERAELRILAAYPDTDLVIHADPYGFSEEHDRDFDGLVVGRLPA